MRVGSLITYFFPISHCDAQGQAMTGLLPILIGMKPTKTHKTRHGHNGLLSQKHQHTVVLYSFRANMLAYCILYTMYPVVNYTHNFPYFLALLISLSFSLSICGFPAISVVYSQWVPLLKWGNGQVGRIVMTAAAQHLTPVTLELLRHWVDTPPWVLSDAFQRFKRGLKGTLKHEEHVLLVRVFVGLG